MRNCLKALGSWLTVSAFVMACGGSKQPPAAPEGAAPETGSAEGESEARDDAGAKASADAADKSEAPSGSKSDAKGDTKATPASDDGPKATRTPQDILTAPDVVFLFSFNDSDVRKVAEEKCSKKAGDNAKKKNECLAAERKNFPADGYRFKKDEHGQWWWITVRQKGNRLVALHKIPVEFAEETANSIALKPTGKDKGSAPTSPPAKVVLEVPNDYEIAQQDPKAGRLVFQAKVGVVTE
jgi:hypothetical protein